MVANRATDVRGMVKCTVVVNSTVLREREEEEDEDKDECGYWKLQIMFNFL